MSYSDVDDARDDDFYRWYVGGSPPEADGWPRHAFENALHHGTAALPSSRDGVSVKWRSASA